MKLTPKTPKPAPFRKKPQLQPVADTWMPIGPGWCYQPGPQAVLPGLSVQATWRPICPGSG